MEKHHMEKHLIVQLLTLMILLDSVKIFLMALNCNISVTRYHCEPELLNIPIAW